MMLKPIRSQKCLDEMRARGRRLGASFVCFVLVAVCAARTLPAQGQARATAGPKEPAAQAPIADDKDPRVKAALARAAVFLKQNTPHMVGELSLVINALAKIHALYPELGAAEGPGFQGLVAELRGHCRDGFSPSRRGGHDNYEAGVAAMALAAASRTDYAAELRNIAEYIVAKQRPDGSWSYDNHPVGDTSQTQYAILGLWEAANAGGGPIPKEAWDKAAQWLIKTQTDSGGFGYQPQQHPEPTHTMTVGSLGSLYICRDYLPGGKPRSPSGVLLPVREAEKAADFKPQADPQALNAAIERATAWLLANFTLDKARGENDPGGGRWFYYYLYAFERFATLAKQTEIAGKDWYAEGAKMLLARQQPNGAWTGGDGDQIQTSFAVLFLTRSTKIIVDDPERLLKRGVLVPFDIDDFLRDARQIWVKPVRDKAGKIIDVILSTRTDADADAGEPLADLLPTKPNTIGERGEILRKVLEKAIAAKDSPTIKTALKGLAATGDYRVVPLLIDALYYEDDPKVQLAARDSLCLISRKFPGAYAGDTAAEWQKEIERWKVWYRSVRPEGEFEDETEIK